MKAPARILITGASTGMGRETALELARRGHEVYAATRFPARLEEVHPGIRPVALDLTDPASVEERVREIGAVDALINNAGYGLVSTVEEADEERMRDQFEVNLFGVLRMCRAVIPGMRERGGGVIVNVSSFLGKIGLPLLTFYNASKYAVEGITDSLRYELRPFGIRVHSVMPGFFDTCFARSNLVTNPATFAEDSPYAEMVAHLAPQIIEQINRGNDPREVAEAIAAILEDDQAPPRVAVGEKARYFIPMRRELDDEAFERRVRDYYGI
jgi:NAD(P)-dependent dehydrogenase (short-subunit alcohol dehydrogenase family)